MTIRPLLATVAILAALVLAACGDDDESSGTVDEPAAEVGQSETTTATTTEASSEDKKAGGGDSKGESAPGTEIVASESQYGSILFDSDEQAIYLFDKEASETSECYGACAEAWPPVLSDGKPLAGDGVEAKLLGTTERDDGSIQVTYAGHPLYYYAHEGPGQVLCHNVAEFGGLWLVVEPSGEAVS